MAFLKKLCSLITKENIPGKPKSFENSDIRIHIKKDQPTNEKINECSKIKTI